MSTSLKIEYANEIAEAMAKALGEDFVKTAAGPALESYNADLAGTSDEESLKLVWNKHLDALNQEGSTDEALQAQAEKAKELGLPGYATPPADDTQLVEDEVCELCGKKVEKDLPFSEEEAEPMAWDANDIIAANFAMKHLVKVADALDGKGFNEVANLVDEAVQKLAKKSRKKL